MTVALKPRNDKNLRELLLEKNIYVSSPCGGNGKCGKCKVKLISGETNPKADNDGFVLACKTKLITECEFYIPDEKEVLEVEYSDKAAYSVCDLGTTNVKINKYSANGTLLSSTTFRNPQFSYGADVVSRISACKNGGDKKLSQILVNGLNEMQGDVSVSYICGNPTMLHFVAGVNPSPIGVFPFEPVFKDTKHLKKGENGLSFDAVLLPSASGYVGSDAVCGIYSILKTRGEKQKNILIADLGTNGEISLITENKIYSASTAAGPAIEGAGIEMGSSGGEGVIYGLSKNGTPLFDGETAKGINGGGLVSVISLLLEKEILSPEGHLENGKYYITKEVYVTEKDICEFMLAKSAVKTAIELLLQETEKHGDIDLFVLTGGVCNYLNINDGVKVGLIPESLKKKAVFIPDLASFGANTSVSKNEIEVLEEIAEKIEILHLNENESFEESFIMNTFFY